MTAKPVRLLVDGIGAASATTAGSPWLVLTAWLGACTQLNVYWLDRGHAPQAAGIRFISFPAHRKGACAADSLLIQQVCDHYGIDVFASSGSTTPVATPALALVDQRTLDNATLGPSSQAQQESLIALAFARVHLCTSEVVRGALPALLHGAAPAPVPPVAADWTAGATPQLVQELGEQVVVACHHLRAQGQVGLHARFFAEWRRLRELQATVDT